MPSAYARDISRKRDDVTSAPKRQQPAQGKKGSSSAEVSSLDSSEANPNGCNDSGGLQPKHPTLTASRVSDNQ